MIYSGRCEAGTANIQANPHASAAAPSQKALCRLPPMPSHWLVSQGAASWATL